MVRTKPIHQMTLMDFERLFPDEDACKDYLAANRWPDGVICPRRRCGNAKVYALESRPHHWQCEKCAENGYRFSVLVGTIFENTNKDLRDWFRVIHLLLTSNKSVSPLQLMSYMDFDSYKTAWYMRRRIRTWMRDPEFHKLMGIVAPDERFIGGKGRK